MSALMFATQQKSPVDVLDYDISFKDWITDDDTITTVVSEVDPAGALAVDSVTVNSPDVKVWVSGGADGSTYEVKITASTTAGRVKKVCFKIRVKDC